MVMVRMSIGSRHRHFGSSRLTEIVEKSAHSMQAVQELAAYAKNHGLFRAASACDVTCSLLSLMFPCGSCCAGSIAGSSSRFQFLRKAPGLAKSVELWGCGGCGIGCEGKLCSSSSFLVLVKRLKKWMYFRNEIS